MKQIRKVKTITTEPTFGVVDSLNSTSTTDGLSANQGRVLNEKIENLELTGGSLEVYPTNEKIIVGTHNDKNVYRQMISGRFTETYANEYWCNTSITNIERILNYNGSVFLSEDDTGVAFGFHYGARLVALTPNGKLRVDATSTNFANKYFECWLDFTEKE